MSRPLRIGFVAALSGPQAIVGVPMARTAQLALSELAPEELSVELVTCDDAADDETAVRVAEQLGSEDSVLAVVGHKNSGTSRAAGPVYDRSGLAQVTPSATDSALSRSGWRGFFRLCADNERQASVAAEYAVRDLGASRPATVHDGTAYGEPLVERFAARARELGVEPGPELRVRVGEEDFESVVSALRACGPDLVYLGATEIEGSRLTVALRRAGLTARVMTAEGGPTNPFARLAGPSAEGSVHTYAGFDAGASEAGRSLADRCRPFGGLPSYGIECYDAVTVVLAALETGARTRREVLDAIAATDLEAVSGRIRFRKGGEREDAPVSLWRVESGRSVRVEGQTLVR